MQGLQVPTWLGILLVLAVPVGTVVGAWLGHRTAAKRDDARWLRERDREDERWKRELERESVAHAHQVRSDWREKRWDFYTSVVVAVDGWRNTMGAGIEKLRLDGTLDTKSLDEVIGCADRAIEAISSAHLVASDEVRVAMMGISRVYLMCTKNLIASHANIAVKEMLFAMDHAGILSYSQGALEGAMRLDLGIGDSVRAKFDVSERGYSLNI